MATIPGQPDGTSIQATDYFIVSRSPHDGSGGGTNYRITGTELINYTKLLTNGGTNASLVASNGGIVWCNASQFQILSGTATANQILLSGSSATPSWSTAIYPATTIINQILYSSANNVITGLATANSAVFATDASGVPKLLIMNSNGNILIGSGSGPPSVGTITQTANQVLVTNGANAITLSAPQNLHTGANFQVATLGVGATNNANATTTITATSAYNTLLTGTQTAVDGSSFEIGLYSNATLNPTNGATTCFGVYNTPIFIAPSGKTITNAYGMQISPIFSSNVGTISVAVTLHLQAGSAPAGTVNNNYTLYCQAPTSGVQKYTAYFDAGVGIGDVNPVNSSAALLVSSTTQGFLPPVMNNTQRGSIGSPAAGLVIYSSTDNDLEFFNGSSWIGSSISGVTSIAGTANQITVSASTGAVTLSLTTNTAIPGNPTTATQASTDNSTRIATTAYVTTGISNAIAGVNPAVAVQAATTTAANTSTWTYSNGVAGIGATFTGPVNTVITIDGFTFNAVNQRLLIKNDTQTPSGAFNGVYNLTALHTVGTGDIYTRALDYDMPSDINNTGAIPVVNGTVNALTSWLLTSSVTTVGTDPLTYSQFSLNPTAILPLNLGGTNANLTANNGGIVWSNSTQLQILAGTATANKILLSGATATPAWSTSTIPTSAGATANKILLSDGTNYVLSTPTFPNASATSGKIIISDGTNWIASTATYPSTNAISTLLYASSANIMSALATANYGVLTTSSTGVPSITGTIQIKSGSNNILTVNTATNIIIGYQAFQSISAGTDNIAIGYQALNQNANTNGNVAIGTQALFSKSAGTDGETAIGYGAAGNQSTGTRVTAIGYNAALDNTAGGNNSVYIGHSSAIGTSPTASYGSDQIGIGYQVLGGVTPVNPTGINEIAIGSFALGKSTTALNNIAIGVSSLATATTVGQSIAIGTQALTLSTTGATNRNIAIGYQASQTLTTATDVIAIGGNAANFLQTGNHGIYIGSDVARGTSAYTAGADNIAIGYQSLGGVTPVNPTGINNITIGSLSMGVATSALNNIAIGKSALAAATIDGQNIAIGTSALAAQVAASATARNVAIGYLAASSVTTGAGVTVIGGNSIIATLTTASNGTYIGANIIASGNVAGEMVIGQGATGKGANTIFLSAPSANAGYFNNAVRSAQSSNVLTFNSSTNEITYTTLSPLYLILSSSSTSLTLDTTMQVVLLTSSSARAVAPPNANSVSIGYWYTIKDQSGTASTANITITPTGSNIDGAANIILASNYASVTFTSDGTNWYIV